MSILKETASGKGSLIRVLVLFAAILSATLIISGVIGWFIDKPEAVSVMGIGGGLYSVSEWAKAFQKKSEKVA